jgi:sirohydrochlorin cobaltochelatase
VSVAYFLVSHGSSSPRSLLAVQEVRDALREMLPQMLIEGGCLEGQAQSLTEQCASFVSSAQQQGYAQVRLIPLFLSAGSHVLQDIPTAIARVAHPLPISITDYFGNFSLIPDYLEQKFRHGQVGNWSTARLLIWHGSRQAVGRQRIKQIADHLSARTATWSDPQSISGQIEQLIAGGTERIYALPYFLFAGKTTEAIAAILQSYPDQVICLPLPFSTADIAEIVCAEIIKKP